MLLLGRAPLESRSRAVIAVYLIAYATLVVTGAAWQCSSRSNLTSRAGWRCACSLFALSIFACAAFLTWMRRLTG